MDKASITPMTADLQRYWMRDQADHAVFVKSDLTVDQAPQAKQAMDYSRKFQAIEEKAVNNAESPEAIAKKAVPLVIDFVRFQNELLRDQLTGHMIAKGYPTFRDHLVRESQYYLRQVGGKATDRTDPEDILFETVFWLRQMAEHSLFLVHWADPYETGLVRDGQSFASRFDELLARARLFVSMLSPQPVPEIPASPGTQLGGIPPLAAETKPVPAVMHLVAKTWELTSDYRDYLLKLKPAEENFANLGIITSLFMDHQTRETQFFIANLENILTGDETAFETGYLDMPFAKDLQEEALYQVRPL